MVVVVEGFGSLFKTYELIYELTFTSHGLLDYLHTSSCIYLMFCLS
jgi:hypothetical protein